MYPTYKGIIILLLTIVQSALLKAQIPVGEWRDHLPYANVKTIALANSRVYCATEMAMFYFDTDDGAIQKLSKINKLSDLEPGYIAFSNEHNKLIIGYLNGNIDIIENDKKFNFPDIKIKNIIADKKINHILIDGDNAYISTGFGIIVFNLERNEFSDTYIIGSGGSYLNVNATAIYNNQLIALTNNGVFAGNLSDPFLSNFQNWQTLGKMQNPGGSYTTAGVFNNKLLLVNTFENDSCHLIEYNTDTSKTVFNNLKAINSIATKNNRLLLTHKEKVDVLNQEYAIEYSCNQGYSNTALMDDDNNIWIGNPWSGLKHYVGSEYKKSIKPDGPKSKNAFKVFYNNGVVQVAPGGYSNSSIRADIYSFNNNSWSNLTDDTNNKDSLNHLRNVIDFTTLGSSNTYAASTWGYGVVNVVNNEIVNVYNATSTDSILGNAIGGLCYDKDGNLHIISNYLMDGFAVKTPQNNWYKYNYNGIWFNSKLNSSRKLICTNNNDLWTISTRGLGIFVYNINNTPENDSDDTYKKFLLKDDANNTIHAQLNDIVQDLEGAIWIATGSGVAVYDYPEYALQNGYDFYARVPQLVDEENIIHGLLDGEKVTCIAVDGGNRKWIGTEGGGLFLVSPDGSEQIISWNTDNSELFSNNIYSLSINQKTGELFIGSDKGLQSYKSTSTESSNSYSNIYAFPNPVEGDYNGTITIRGLMYETNVKITDISGNKVYESISNGGDAIWNGKDLNGNKVTAGIYLVLCTLPDGSQSEATKILIVN